MFNPEDRNYLLYMLQKKHPDAYVIPVYVQMYRDAYLISELDQIRTFNPSGFRVGFCARISMFDKHSFPQEKMISYPIEDTFIHENLDKNTDDRVVVFSISKVESEMQQSVKHDVEIHDKRNSVSFYNQENKIDEVDRQVAYYYNMLKDHIANQCARYRKKLIEEQMQDQMTSSQ